LENVQRMEALSKGRLVFRAVGKVRRVTEIDFEEGG